MAWLWLWAEHNTAQIKLHEESVLCAKDTNCFVLAVDLVVTGALTFQHLPPVGVGPIRGHAQFLRIGPTALGIDIKRAKSGFAKLYELIQSITAEAQMNRKSNRSWSWVKKPTLKSCARYCQILSEVLCTPQWW